MALHYVEVLIEKYPDINRNKLKRRLCKLAEKVDRISEEKKDKFYSAKKVKSRIKRFKNLLVEVEEKVHTKQNKYYELLNYFIKETRNINYIEVILDTFSNAVNVKNENGDSIFYTIITGYIEEVENNQDAENNEDILYYNNLISLFNSKKRFELSDTERVKCLQQIYLSIEKLSKKDPNYKKKIELLDNVKNMIKKEDIDRKTIKNIAPYYNIKIDFEEEVIEELNMYKTSYSKTIYPDRKIVDDYIVTIDGISAKEIDDGLSAKVLPNGNYLLGVHIASVLAYFPFESKVVEEALSRGSSIYTNSILSSNKDEFAKTIPILPYQFSAIDGSLLENCERLTNSYFFEIDRCGNVINKTFAKTIITNNKQCTYQDANKIIEHGCEDKKLEETIQLLSKISYALQEKFDPTEIYTTIKQQANDPAGIILGNSRGEQIVNQAMILTGSEVANWFKDPTRDYPCLLRVHEINEECNKRLGQIINNFEVQADKAKFERLFELLIGIYPKAHYDLNGRHDGLDLDNYCHVTSPLRRAADILQEHALDVCYFNNPTDKELYELENRLLQSKSEINSQNNSIDYFLEDCKLQKKMVRTINNRNR